MIKTIVNQVCVIFHTTDDKDASCCCVPLWLTEETDLQDGCEKFQNSTLKFWTQNAVLNHVICYL